MQLLRLCLVAGMLAVLFTGCGTATGALPTPIPAPATASPIPVPTAAPATAMPVPTQPAATEGVIVTLRVADRETYRILLTDPTDIATARKLLAGQQAPSIPNGVVVRGDPGVNTGYSWHIDPDTLEFVDMTMEVCDGTPSDVEQGIITSQQFCPWSAKVVAVEQANLVAAETLLVALTRSGGIAGINETITVYANGQVELRSRNGQTRIDQASPTDLEALRQLLASPALAQADSRYQANGADLFTYELTLPGSGKPRTITTMDGAPHPEVLSLLIAELEQLRPQN